MITLLDSCNFLAAPDLRSGNQTSPEHAGVCPGVCIRTYRIVAKLEEILPRLKSMNGMTDR